MNIHHKFIALFNATPGAYANTPSLNDTNLLLGFVETVTGVDVTEDSDFIDHVLTNMGFVQDEDSDLWDTAHGAMTGLVSANGRASAVDTAIQFLTSVGEDPTSDYFTPANRLVRKASASEVATEANSAETNANVLTSVFDTTYYRDAQIDQGVLTGSTLSLNFLNPLAPENLNIVPVEQGVGGLEQTRLVGTDLNLEVEGVDVLDSVKVSDINLSVTQNNFDLGPKGGVEYQSIADFSGSTILLSGDGNDLNIGIANSNATETGPLFTLRLTDSTLTTSEGGDVRVAPSWRANSNGELIATNSTLAIGDDLEIGQRDDNYFASEYRNEGSVSFISSTVNIIDNLIVGRNGGTGSLSLDATSVTVANELIFGQNTSVSDDDNSASYTSSLISTGSLTLGNGSSLNGDMLTIGGTKGSVGTATVDGSTLALRGILVAAGSADNNEASVLTQGARGTLEVTNSTVDLYNGDSDIGLLQVGQTNGAVGTATFNSSTINGIRYLEVGGDRNPDDRIGGSGTVTFNDSTVTQRSSLTLDQYQKFTAVIGREGGVGEVNLNNSSFTTIVDSVITQNDSSGYYYTGWHVGRQGSDLTSSSEYDGTLRLNNSTVSLLNEGIGNADLYFGLGARSEGQGLLELISGSTLILETNNTNAAESAFYVAGRSDSSGNALIDNSSIQVRGSAQMNTVQIGLRGAGDMEVSNGGTLIVTTIGDGSNVGSVRVGDKGGAGTLSIDGAGSVVGGDAYTTMTIGERPESQYNASPSYEADATADTYAGTTGSVELTNGALLQFGTAGDGIADIFVGNGGSLIASDDSTVVGDIQIIGTGTVSDNLLAYVI